MTSCLWQPWFRKSAHATGTDLSWEKTGGHPSAMQQNTGMYPRKGNTSTAKGGHMTVIFIDAKKHGFMTSKSFSKTKT